MTSSVLPENCVWHSGHLKLLYCSPSAFLQGSGISACGPWGARRTGRGCDAAGDETSFSGLELAETVEPPAVVEEEETGGEEDEEETSPGQPKGGDGKRQMITVINEYGLRMNNVCFITIYTQTIIFL